MLVKEVMNSDVKTIEPDESILEAARKMNEFGIGCLIVARNETRLAGILTDSDILGKVVAKDKRASRVNVRQVMTRKLVLIDENEDISKAAELMKKHNIKKLPVISRKTLVGILTVSDLAQAQPKLIKQVSRLMVFPKDTKSMAG